MYYIDRLIGIQFIVSVTLCDSLVIAVVITAYLLQILLKIIKLRGFFSICGKYNNDK